MPGISGTYAAVNPAFTGGYVFSQASHTGTVGAHNHLSLTNPLGSGHTIALAGVFVSSVALGPVSAVDPLRGWRATGVSGGTLQTASDIVKIRTGMPDPVGQVRIEGMTATLGAPWFNSPTLVATGLSLSPFIHQIPTTIQAGTLSLVPGESVVLRTETGDLDTLWNLSIAWSEF